MAGCTILSVCMTMEAYDYEMREKVRKVMTGFPDSGSFPIAGPLMHKEFFELSDLPTPDVSLLSHNCSVSDGIRLQQQYKVTFPDTPKMTSSPQRAAENEIVQHHAFSCRIVDQSLLSFHPLCTRNCYQVACIVISTPHTIVIWETNAVSSC
jgi:hypothetical protein